MKFEKIFKRQVHLDIVISSLILILPFKSPLKQTGLYETYYFFTYDGTHDLTISYHVANRIDK